MFIIVQQFIRKHVYTSDKEESRTVAFVINVYQDKKDSNKIWMVSNDILNPTEINNHQSSINYHPKMFERLRKILIEENRWRE